MAAVILGGLASSTALVLVVMPVLYVRPALDDLPAHMDHHLHLFFGPVPFGTELFKQGLARAQWLDARKSE